MNGAFCQFVCAVLLCHSAAVAEECRDFYSSEVDRFAKLLASAAPQDQIEAVKGLSGLREWKSEQKLIPLLQIDNVLLQREVILALDRIGTSASVRRLIQILGNASWELRRNAELALEKLTAQSFGQDRQRWDSWWNTSDLREKEKNLLSEIVQADASGAARLRLVEAWSHLAEPGSETALLQLSSGEKRMDLSPQESDFVCAALERIGTQKAVPVLAGIRSDAAAWSLGRIGGPQAEAALLAFPKTFATLVNLDRLHSTNTASFLPLLIHSFGLITYRAHPDDLNFPEPQPIQQVAANLIRRSGSAPLIIEATLRELETTMNPPIPNSASFVLPAALAPVFSQMREELKPGFIRGDGETTSQPLVALYCLCDAPTTAQRLRPLLNHPAIVPRIYVAMLLGKLRATEAIPDLVTIIREGYKFSDATAIASGKHFDQSQTIRWRGFLCMALGRMGSDAAREELEELCLDQSQPRDVRYGAVVGLGFNANALSAGSLRKVADNDPIWMIRTEAMESLRKIASHPSGKIQLAQEQR